MTMFEANEILVHWSKYPPLHLMIQKFLGIEIEGAGGGGNASHDDIVRLSGGTKPLPNELRKLEKRDGR